MRVKKNINLGIISWTNTKFSKLIKNYKNCLVGSKENCKFDVGVKRLPVTIYLLGIIVFCLHMFRILHALISLISMWVLIIC